MQKSSRKRWKEGPEIQKKLLVSAIILIVLSAGLFLNTRGTRLLYVSVMAGRASRYYWIFLLAAMALGVIGMITLRSYCRGNCAEKQQK